ncbi:hypothetical protein MLD38_040305 [Melastoma candidum]|uniref:Uncharacterized protein n=1 Tax=Melastoma candidum TaxID=119954 RepID=A0ACB9L4S8_9MYRT|nr:hypothetical protein MLD38_040305 [Melastoma candidum]
METKDSEDIVGVGGGEVSGNRRFPGEEGVGSCITRHEGVAEEKEAEGEIRGGLEKEGNRRGFREVDRSPSSPAADEAAVHLPKETGRCCRQESLPETHPTVAGAADLRKPCLVAVVVVPETSLDDPKAEALLCLPMFHYSLAKNHMLRARSGACHCCSMKVSSAFWKPLLSWEFANPSQKFYSFNHFVIANDSHMLRGGIFPSVSVSLYLLNLLVFIKSNVSFLKYHSLPR